MKNSAISWTDNTFNPWIGCTKVSPGCAHCYAAEQNKLRKWTAGGEWGKERRRTSTANWKEPVKWNAAAANSNAGLGDHAPFGQTRPRVFCASLADWLDDEVPVEWLVDLLALIHTTPNLDWLLLTKRPENWAPRMTAAYKSIDPGKLHMDSVLSMLERWGQASKKNNKFGLKPPQNVWIGTTVENQDYADRRIPKLLNIPAKVHFLRVEPMLGPVDLARMSLVNGVGYGSANPLQGVLPSYNKGQRGPSISWVICGGESGPQRRPFEIEWALSLADQCTAAGVPFFMKQDASLLSGRQGRIPDALWNRKEFPSP